MKNKIRISALSLSCTLMLSLFTGCGQDMSYDMKSSEQNAGMNYIDVQESCDAEEVQPMNTEEYNAVTESGFKNPQIEPLSTFSADVDTASYTNIRRFINLNNGQEVPEGAVRIEEMLNYFSYDYPEPQGDTPFSTSVEISDCPWNQNTKLMRIGLQTKKLDKQSMPDSNIVFLIDSSGSMESADKLPLVKSAFAMLTENMNPNDRISIVTYAGSSSTLIEGATAEQKDEIFDALYSINAYGSTNGSGGIETAYSLAEQYFIEDGNNRVILATDGDLNVGITSESELKKLVEKKRKSGIYLSVLGFGTGNIKDNKMETLADNGNGNYSYIDSESEAEKVLVNEMGGTLFTVAKDVKFQVEFNPSQVKGYRLIGYDNRLLQSSDFEDDSKDAGEIGAGHSVTVLYEVALTGSEQEIPEYNLEFSDNQNLQDSQRDELCKISTRYKPIDSDESILNETLIDNSYISDTPSDDFIFASSVAEFGMLLKNSEYKGNSSYEDIISRLGNLNTNDTSKQEFLNLVKKVKE